MKKFNFIEIQFSNLLWIFENYLPSTIFNAIFKNIKKRTYEKRLRKLKRFGKGKVIPVEKIENLDPKTFFYKYYLRGKPVIFKGAAKDWECSKWDFDFFKQNYGEEETMITGHGDMNINNLGQAIDSLRGGNVKNARVCNVIQNNPELMQQADLGFLKRFISWPSFTTSYQFFLGTIKNFTPLHAGMTNNFSIQLHGHKRWKIVDTHFNPVIRPIADGGPLLKSELDLSDENMNHNEAVKYIDIYDAYLEEGDILFNPSFFWHYIEYQNESITIGLRWLNVFSILKSSLLMGVLVLTAYNPSAFQSFFTIRKGKAMPFYR